MQAPTVRVQFTVRGVLWALLVTFLVQAGLFAYSFITKTDPVNFVDNRLPAVAPVAPRLAYYITGSWGDGALKKPLAVAVADRRIYVADTNNQRVQVFDYNGRPLFRFGSAGEGPGQFKFPYGLAGLPDSRILVADLYNGSVSSFDNQGKFLGYFGEADPKEGVFEGPAGLFVSGDRIYVSDVRKNQIMVFDAAGKKLLEFGSKGSGEGQFASPNAVAVYKEKIYVADSGNDRIQVFDETGRFLKAITGSKEPGGQGTFVNLRGLGFDGQGIMYAVSSLTNLVQGMDSEGQPLFAFGGVGSGDNQFYIPNGLFVDDQGRIYITDTANARVAVYQN